MKRRCFSFLLALLLCGSVCGSGALSMMATASSLDDFFGDGWSDKVQEDSDELDAALDEILNSDSEANETAPAAGGSGADQSTDIDFMGLSNSALYSSNYGLPSYSELTEPSESLEFVSSGNTVSTYATDAETGYRLDLNGVEQKLTGASTNNYSYNGHSYPYIDSSIFNPYTGGNSYFVFYGKNYPYMLLIDGYLFVCTVRPFFKSSSSSLLFTGSSSSPSYYLRFTYDSASNSFDFSSYSDSGSSTYTNYVFGGGSVNKTNIIWSNFDILLDDGSVLFEASDPVPQSIVFGPFSFPSSEMTTLGGAERSLVLVGDPQTGTITGDQIYSFTATDPYIDVELPLSDWTSETVDTSTFESFSLDGTVSLDLAIGLWSKVVDSGNVYYALSDLVPSTWQLIVNGSVLTGDTLSGTFDSSARTDSGYTAELTLSSGAISFASVSTGDQAEVPETIGFRIYLTSASGGAATTITNTYTFDSVTPYVYLDFNNEDGTSGLPALTFNVTSSGGDDGGTGSGSGSSSGSSYDDTEVLEGIQGVQDRLDDVNTNLDELEQGIEDVNTNLDEIEQGIGDVDQSVDEVKDSVDSVKDSVDALPDKIGGVIEDAFTPSEDSVQSFGDKLKAWLKDELGFIWQIYELIDTTVNNIREATTGEGYQFVFPGISIPMNGEKYQIVAEQEVSLDNEFMDVVRPVLGAILCIISTVAVFNVIASVVKCIISGYSWVQFLRFNREEAASGVYDVKYHI